MQGMVLPSRDLDESHVSSAERWRELIAGIYAPIVVDETTGGFSGKIRNADIDGIQVSRLRVGRHVTERQAHDIASDESPKLVLCVQLSGLSLVSQGNRSAILRAGDMTVYNTNAPYELDFKSDAECMGVVIPWRSLTQAPHAMEELAGRIMVGVDPVVRAVAHAIDGIEPSLLHVPLDSRRRLVNHIVGLTETLCQAQTQQHSDLGSGLSQRDRLSQLLRFIESNLSDPELSVKTIAADLFISTRSLQNLTSSAGFSIASWIRTRRLEMCRVELVESPERTVSDIAVSWGFSGGSSHFTQTFKGAYGVTPSQYRSQYDAVRTA